tara:strand:+ start:65 stop:772 length:708 start_codon:yes stop_codon:yes gene_type:complete
MRKKIKINQKNLNLYLIIIFLVIIFLIKIDLFRNTYSLLNENYNQRMIRIYGDCSKDSFGFLTEIKNKYNFKENPKINNSEIIPSSDWIIYDPKLNFSDKPKIFLNYSKNPTLNFTMLGNKFVSTNYVQFTDNLKSIQFIAKKENINFNIKLKIFKEINSKKELVFEKFLNQPFNKINFNTEKFNSRWERFILEIENLTFEEKKDINSIILTFDNKYRFKDSDIIFSRGDCFYTR